MRPKKVRTSQYKGVTQVKQSGEVFWIAQGTINGLRFAKRCENEREAAVAYDKKMIECGRKPVNILKSA